MAEATMTPEEAQALLELQQNTSPTTYPQLLALLKQGGGSIVVPGSDEAQRLLRGMALSVAPARAGAIGEALAGQQRLAQGSPQEVLQTFHEQINQIQQQLQQQAIGVARQGGRGMGGQRARAQGQTLGKAAQAYQGILGQAVLQGQKGLLGLVTGVRPLTATQIPPSSESITSEPFNLEETGGSIVTLASQLQRLLAPGGEQTPNIRPALQQQQWQNAQAQLSGNYYGGQPQYGSPGSDAFGYNQAQAPYGYGGYNAQPQYAAVPTYTTPASTGGYDYAAVGEAGY